MYCVYCEQYGEDITVARFLFSVIVNVGVKSQKDDETLPVIEYLGLLIGDMSKEYPVEYRECFIAFSSRSDSAVLKK